jgi:hypothetical protein
MTVPVGVPLLPVTVAVKVTLVLSGADVAESVRAFTGTAGTFIVSVCAADVLAA